MTQKSINQENMARHNRATVLMHIRRSREISRVELSQKLNLGKPAITKISSQLLDSGIILEKDSGSVKRDKPRSVLYLNKDWGYVVVLSLMYELSIGLVNMAGDLVHKKHIRGNNFSSKSYVKDFDKLVPETVSRYVKKHKNKNILGIGVLSAGYVSESGVIHHNAELPRYDIDMTEVLSKVTDLPVFTDQELRLLLLSKLWEQNTNKEWRNIVALNPGLFGNRGRHALAVDEKLYYGRSGMIGLPGNMTGVPYNIRNTESMIEKVYRMGGIDAFIEKITNNNSEANKMFQKAIKNYGFRISRIFHTYDPDVIFLYSPYFEFGESFLNKVKEEAINCLSSDIGDYKPDTLENFDIVFAGKRCKDEWLKAASIPVLSKVFLNGDLL